MNIKATMAAAAEIRKLTILSMASAGYGHIGGSMSICDVLAVLYMDIMNVDPNNSKKADRDWLVLSKGHCGPALYAALAYKGYFPREELMTLNADGTKLPSHCDRLKTNGVDISTGSLGQGISLAAGVALGNRMQCIDSMAYAILGDGELQEGQNWEAFQFIAHWQLNNLVVIIDNNRRQLDGYTKEICDPLDLRSKLMSFGLRVLEANGHDVREIYMVLCKARQSSAAAIQPTAVILNTIKGYGCNFAEIDGFNHYMAVTPQMAVSAIAEIDRKLEERYAFLG